MMTPMAVHNQEELSNQILKCRDDKERIIFRKQSDGTFILTEGSCSWLKKDEQADVPKLRKRIEPWLTALFQSEHFSLLIGSGLTHAVHHLATNNNLPGMSTAKFSVFEEQINNAACASCKKLGRGEEANLEDQIRVANELLTGLKHYSSGELSGDIKELEDKIEILENDIETNLRNFAQFILNGENELAVAQADKRQEAFKYLVNFLMSFASRSGTRDRLNIFTTNYDRIIEAGAELAGLHLLDRFVGNLFPIFRSSRLNIDMHYNPPGIRGEPRYLEGVAYFTKLHGSVDWINAGRDIRRIGLPFGAADINTYLNLPGMSEVNALKIMIYPNSAKDRETALYPYVELFRDFAAAICRPNHTLVIFGYSFGDEHINRVIDDMLTIPSTHLVIISFDDKSGRIMKNYERIGRPSQCTLMIGNHLGNLKALVDYYLPKPAIDRTTYRMAELIKKRLEADDSQTESNSNTNNGTEENK